MSRRFYKTTITVEVLSEEPLGDELDLEHIKYLITDGPCSGRMHHTTKQLTAKAAAKALIEHDSDPSFFGLDEHGREVGR